MAACCALRRLARARPTCADPTNHPLARSARNVHSQRRLCQAFRRPQPGGCQGCEARLGGDEWARSSARRPGLGSPPAGPLTSCGPPARRPAPAHRSASKAGAWSTLVTSSPGPCLPPGAPTKLCALSTPLAASPACRVSLKSRALRCVGRRRRRNPGRCQARLPRPAPRHPTPTASCPLNSQTFRPLQRQVPGGAALHHDQPRPLSVRVALQRASLQALGRVHRWVGGRAGRVGAARRRVERQRPCRRTEHCVVAAPPRCSPDNANRPVPARRLHFHRRRLGVQFAVRRYVQRDAAVHLHQQHR